MVSILYRVHQNLMFLGEKNWANRYAPATNKKPCHLRWQGFLLPAGTVFEPTIFLRYGPVLIT